MLRAVPLIAAGVPVAQTQVYSATDAAWMRLALAQARMADAEDRVPVGCVLVRHAAASEETAMQVDCFRNGPQFWQHAEMLAVQSMPAFVYDARTTLIITLEPCPMCWGAIKLARIPKVIYGARSFASDNSLSTNKSPWPAKVVGGVLEDECSQLVSGFFRRQRQRLQQS